jgi:hypothetical protein
MKKIIIKRIQLSNWKAKNLDVTFNDGVTKISAKNEVGKSSLQQAWNWLFTSYASPTSARNSNLFDNRLPLSPDTPEARVSVWLDIDGVTYTLERSAKASFKRPRGSEEWVKDSSDTYTTLIDGIEYTATNFAEWVESVIAPIDMMPYLLDGAFFTTLSITDKMKARAVIEQLVGGCDISELKGDYSMLGDKLHKYTPEQLREQASSFMRPIKKRMDAIPAIIKSKEFVINDLARRYDRDKIHDKVMELSQVVAKDTTKETISELVGASMQLGIAEYAKVELSGIDLLRKEAKELARTLAELEGEKYLIEELMEERAEIIGNKVNKILNGYQIEMFNVQKNGDKNPDCVVTDMDGVKFATLSNSARLRANIAIQNMFRKVLGVDMITWIDESSIFDSEHLPKPTGQTCYLFAGESDTLVVE